MNTSDEHSIIITPVGETEPTILEEIGLEVEGVFGYPTRTIPLIDDLEFALDPLRNQYHSTAILERLSDLAPADALKVLAISHVDLFIPILTHVYGEAQLDGKACIISDYRLKESDSPASNPDAFHSRILKEAIHEIGHTFGLRHCPDHACIMHYCRTVPDVDRKSKELCRYCKVFLQDGIGRLTQE